MNSIEVLHTDTDILLQVSGLDATHRRNRIAVLSNGNKHTLVIVPPYSDAFTISISNLNPDTNYNCRFIIYDDDLATRFIEKEFEVKTMARTPKHGIDVSYAQSYITWGDVTGVDFVIVRAGYGQNNIDEQAVRNCSAVNAHNIPLGLYWFSYAYTAEMARNEGRYAAAFARSYNLSLPIFFDFEDASVDYAEAHGVTVTPQLLRSMAQAFCEEISAAGYEPGIYTNPNFIVTYYGRSFIANYPLWLASWRETEPTEYDWKIWQYGTTTVSGIVGLVDGDIMYDVPTRRKKSKMWMYLKQL